jgi:hypothetical protein
MVSPYKDYSSVIRWQANLCVPLCNYRFAPTKVWCDFGVLSFFLVYEDGFSCLWLCRTIRACGCLFFVVFEIILIVCV